jgi:hypothetical protein
VSSSKLQELVRTFVAELAYNESRCDLSLAMLDVDEPAAMLLRMAPHPAIRQASALWNALSTTSPAEKRTCCFSTLIGF